MRIELNSKDVRDAIEYWYRDHTRLSGPVEILGYTGYSIQTDPEMFLHTEKEDA